MKTPFPFLALTVIGWLAAFGTAAQIYVTPKMGGGQTTADMVHIDLYYDAGANVFHAHVDDSYGVPELRALEPGQAFDPQARYAVLDGKAYNAQYGWNAGGLFSIPAGAAIWIELLTASPGLETYEGWGRLGTYTPIFGTAGSPRRWLWSGVMVHNTYAVLRPSTDRWFAEYHIYFGDPVTGARDGFMHLDDVYVQLEWTTVPGEAPGTFHFGATSLTPGAPLAFLDADQFVTAAEHVVNLRFTNTGPYALQYQGVIPMAVVAATATHGGPVPNHALLGACVECEVISLTGPRGGSLSFWEAGETQPCFTVPVGLADGTNRFRLSAHRGAAGSDPYGRIEGRCFTTSQPGLYELGFRLVDTSTNGPSAGPLHAPSATYQGYLQAGAGIASLAQTGAQCTAVFGGDPELIFHLEQCATLAPTAVWTTVAGPLPGTNQLQRLTCARPSDREGYFRLRLEPGR